MPYFKNACHILTETREQVRRRGWRPGALRSEDGSVCAIGALSYALGNVYGERDAPGYVTASDEAMQTKGLLKAMIALAERMVGPTSKAMSKSERDAWARERSWASWERVPRRRKIGYLESLIVEGNDTKVKSSVEFMSKLDQAIQDVCLDKGDDD